MKQFYFLLVIFSLLFTASKAQQFRYTVNLKYKKAAGYSLAQPSAFLSQKAIDRRLKQKIKIDSTDLPINKAYIDSIAKIPGVVILNSSKWLNQVLIETNDVNAIVSINAFPFVIHSSPVALNKKAPRRRTANIASAEGCADSPMSIQKVQSPNADTINYGVNYNQVHIHEGEYLHNKGFRGQGITIAILDAGFYKYTTNPAFDSVRNDHRVLGTYDFVNNETSVDEDNSHGANCFSIMAANRPGFIVGTAPNASYWLFKTEDVPTEKPIEEYNWVAGAERADSAGADMISSSLGYINFDDPSYNHSYADRNGNTALITVAADMAAKKGMIVMNSIGNSGNNADDTKYVMCPADGDSVVTVGSVNNSGIISGFSSWGPNSVGKIKPNIVSVGEGTVYANAAGDPWSGNGTSYSNPNIAGLIACLWQAFYEFSNMDIIDAVQRSAHKFNTPDDRYGYGIPNFRVAYTLLEAKRQAKTDAILQGKWITAFPVPFRQMFTIFLKAPASGNANIRLIDLNGKILLEKTLHVQQGSHYTIPMNATSVGRYGIYYLQYSDGKNTTTVKLMSL